MVHNDIRIFPDRGLVPFTTIVEGSFFFCCCSDEEPIQAGNVLAGNVWNIIKTFQCAEIKGKWALTLLRGSVTIFSGFLREQTRANVADIGP